METIKIKYFGQDLEKLEYIGGKSDWIDLRASETVELKAGDFKLIPLGVAMELPPGYEAHVVPGALRLKHTAFCRPIAAASLTAATVGTRTCGKCRCTPQGTPQSRKGTGFASSVLWRTSRKLFFRKQNFWKIRTGAVSAPPGYGSAC